MPTVMFKQTVRSEDTQCPQKIALTSDTNDEYSGFPKPLISVILQKDAENLLKTVRLTVIFYYKKRIPIIISQGKMHRGQSPNVALPCVLSLLESRMHYFPSINVSQYLWKTAIQGSSSKILESRVFI